MIRAIIVEDEQVIRNGIEMHVPWKELGVDKVCSAENAEEAFFICEDYKPDIIISDIRMPGMNGIELCTRFREKLPESQIIFISGYSDKEYLLSAISLGAISYVEKPIAIPELSEAIEKAVVSVYRLNKQNANVLHSLLQPNESDAESAINALHLFERGKFLDNDTIFYIGLLKAKEEIRNAIEFEKVCQDKVDELIQKKSLHFMVDSIDSNIFVFLLSGDVNLDLKDTGFKKQLCEIILSIKKPEEKWFLGVGKEVEGLELLSESYQTAREALKALSYKGWNSYAFNDETSYEYKEKLPIEEQNRFHKLLLAGKEKEANEMLDEIYQKLIENCAILNFYVRNLYFTIHNIIVQSDKALHLNDSKLEEHYDIRFLDEAQSIEEMHEYILQHIKYVLEEAEEGIKNSFLIKTVIDYMNDNLKNKEITIQLLADVVYLTPTYLSNLFKKKTGMTIGQYLELIRIKKAEELLQNPFLKLYQVAEMVGYQDANYFSKIFKKRTGMLPSEYRESKMV